MRKSWNARTSRRGLRGSVFAGYSRAVRIGPFVCVSGTTASDAEGNLIGGDDPYAQTVAILDIIEAALNEAGASIADVVRTRVYVADFNHWREISRSRRALRAKPASEHADPGGRAGGRALGRDRRRRHRLGVRPGGIVKPC